MSQNNGGFQQRGVVEGFYGRVWTEEERHAFIEALLPFGINTYFYCPKHEPALASGCLEPLEAVDHDRFKKLTGFCRDRQISPWAGLHLEPPFQVTESRHLDDVARKIMHLHQAGFTGFTFLFDDLSGAEAPGGPFEGSLAAAQAHAVTEIIARAKAQGVEGAWLVCPSVYTLDPILEKEYGPYESDYLARLDRGLPPEVAWFWTGPKVLSPTITLGDLTQWQSGLTRPVVLWDNYPVNDMAMQHSLHLSPLSGRAADLPQGIQGYLFNPLLQPALGIVPGATCLAYAANPAGYDLTKAWSQSISTLLPASLQQAFGELEALTRRCCLVEFPSGLPSGGTQSFLSQRLKVTWESLEASETETRMDTSLVEELGALLELLRGELPGTMAQEAAPWLDRLQAAHGVMAIAAKEGKKKAIESEAAQAYRAGEAFVLGKWFEI